MEYLRRLLFDLFETLQAVRTWQKNFASFQILLLWQPESKLLSIVKKQKIYCSSKKCNLEQYSLTATGGRIQF